MSNVSLEQCVLVWCFMHEVNVGKPQAKWDRIEISTHKELLIQIYSSSLHRGKGKLSYFWCSVHMLTVPTLRCGSVSEPSSRTNPPLSRPSALHPPPWLTTAAGAAASYLIMHRRDNTILKRPSQHPAQILSSAMKNSSSRASSGSFGE